MSTEHPEFYVSGDRIIRPAMNRLADAESSQRYMEQVHNLAKSHEAHDPASCPFCPEKLFPRNKLIEEIGSHGLRFYRIESSGGYDYYDSQKIRRHDVIVPEKHITDFHDLPGLVRLDIDDYIHSLKQAAPPDTVYQEYTRSPGNPSKSVEHAHINGFLLEKYKPVSKAVYDATNGLTEIEYGQLTPEQIDAMNQHDNKSV